jgi:hypothetical protein
MEVDAKSVENADKVENSKTELSREKYFEVNFFSDVSFVLVS